MRKPSLIYEETRTLTAIYNHPTSDDYLEYKSTIRIKNSGKNPVEMILNFNGIYPFAAPMPPEEHKFTAPTIVDLFAKVDKWFEKYGYLVK